MNLRKVRETKNLSQKEIAKLLNVSRSTYSIWELELDLIPIKRLINFSNILNVSIDYCLGLTNIPQYPDNKKEDYNLSISRIKEIRLTHKDTQEYLANKLNIDRSLLSKYEKGANIISTTFLIEYAKLYKISADYLLGKRDTKIIYKTKIKKDR